jgi:FixJ family two-component response regulator
MELAEKIHTIQLDPADQTLVNSLAQNRAAVSHASMRDFLERYRPGDSGCVLLKLPSHGEEDLAPLEQLRAQGILLPVIAVVDDPSTELTVGAMRRGADSVLSTPLGRASLQRELNRALDLNERQRAIRRQRETIAAALASLNEGERAVLARLMSGMANKNIAAELQIGLRTVELRRAKILKKLGARSLAEMVRLVLLAEPERLYPE